MNYDALHKAVQEMSAKSAEGYARDRYLVCVANGFNEPYEQVLQRFKEGDAEVIEARCYVKHLFFSFSYSGHGPDV